ncbi:pseudaminic acid synthase [Hyphobacterium sp.]|uniref:pseudaminic acid synthase n=1 Tax=Hyphobacterium sp. TaxID=2004662 RepID=UPI003BAB3AD0
MTRHENPPRAAFAIAGREIGDGHAPYVIAEVSGNHNKDLSKALKMIEVAADCGADAVKFQTYTADSLTLPSVKPDFQITTGTWAGWNLHQLYQEAATPYDWFPALFDHGRALGITVFSSPFDNDAVDLLEGLEAPAYKIASNEFTDWPLIRRTVQTGKPVILSTGTATLEEIDVTVAFLEREGITEFALLHCVSAYPAPIDSARMRNITALRERFPVPIGFSDHTLDITAPIVATSLGASIIEKHFVLDRSEGGPDSSFAIEPEELRRLCETVRDAHTALGGPQFGMKGAETKSPIYRRHFYATRDIAAGEEISAENVKAIRARKGIAARDFERLFGAKVSVDIPAHEPVTWEAIDECE